MNIFIGTHENCGIIHNLENGFKHLGHGVTSLVKSRDPFFKTHKYTFDLTNGGRFMRFDIPILNSILFRINNVIKKIKTRIIFSQEIINNDIFIYTWDTVLPNLKDLKLIKKKGKKIVFLFIGSDVRSHEVFKQQYVNINIPLLGYMVNNEISDKLNFIRPIEFYADLILSLPDQSGLLIRPYDHLYLPFKIDHINFKIPNNDVPRIIHAPSKRDIKGTLSIIETIDKLKRDGFLFDFILLENMSNDVILRQLEQADIAIDQIYLHGPAMFATEAMASGCAVATNYLEEYKKIFPAPVCNVNEFNLYDGIKKLITDKEYRLSLASQGRQFVEKFNDPTQVAKRILDQLEQQFSSYDYYPQFFINDFNLTDGDTISVDLKEQTRQIVLKYFSEEETVLILNKLSSRNLV